MTTTIGSKARTILPILLTGLALAVSTGGAQTFGAYRELWTGLSTSDTSIGALTNSAVNAAYPNSPNTNYTRILTNFETEVNYLDGYGERVRAYIVPPVDGEYTFWISSDDQSNLFLSTDESPTNASLIATVTGWTDSRVWNKEGNQMSALIRLQAGKRLYLEALMKEGGGGDNLAVRWQLPSGAFEEPLPATSTNGTFLIPCWNNTNLLPGIYRQPASLTSMEQATARFSVLVTNPGPVSYQWRMDAADLPGPQSALLLVSNLTVADHDGRGFSCVISNAAGMVTSQVAILAVQPDVVPPSVLWVATVTPTNLMVTYSEPVSPALSLETLNYVFSGDTAVESIAAYDPQTVVLTLSPPFVPGTLYDLTIPLIQDLATLPNNSTAELTFTATAYAAAAIGAPPLPASALEAPGGFDITASGADIGGVSDQFQFDYQLVTGDFDIQVRVAALSQSDLWAKAGLMARESLAPNSRFAAVLASPGLAGAFFESRTDFRVPAALAGSLPVSFPRTWLRLHRAGNVFTGFASLNGSDWVRLGSANLNFTNFFLGFATASHNPAQTTRVEFRDLGPVSGGAIGSFAPPFEPLGPSSRKTGMVISELHYKPAPDAGGRQLEFIELFNSNPFFEDLSGWRLTGDVDFTFPAGTKLPGQSFLVLAKVPADVQAHYGITGVLGYGIPAGTNSAGVVTNYSNSLPGRGGVVRLEMEHGQRVLEVNYSDQPPWPVGTDGAGHSLVLARPSYGENDPAAWARSDSIGGSPGRYEPFTPDSLRSVLINEFYAHSDEPAAEYIELYNHSPRTNDLSGCVLTDDALLPKCVLAPGTLIGPHEFLALDRSQLGFGLNAGGQSLYLWAPGGARILDAIRYEPQALGRSSGRVPDGASEFYPLQSRTPGAANGGLFVGDVVINEIMYAPISLNDDDQFVELYNRGATPADLSGWQFTAGINFTFPSNTILAPDAYLVVARNPARLLASYSNLTESITLGAFTGRLSGNGERLALGRPDISYTTNSHGVASTNIVFVVEDEVTYHSGGQWPAWADQGGSSLELVDPRASHRLPSNWADSDETAKAPWTFFGTDAPLTNGMGPANLVELGLQGEGECLLDNVGVTLAGSTANLVTNGSFEGGLAGWALRGNHARSTLETNTGYASLKSLHIRASSRVDYGANRVVAPLTTTLTSGSVSIRGQARWLRGWPELLVSVHGFYAEASARLTVPSNLGTPGQPNSRAATNAPPAVYEVAHQPVLPGAMEEVRVTARAMDPDGLTAVVLNYRIDPSTIFTPVLMVDDGTEGDEVPGDGIYTARIPGQPASTLVAFVVTAADSATPGMSGMYPTNTPVNAFPRECLVRFGDPVVTSAFGSYRQWFTQRAVTNWINRPVLSNEPLEGAFVYGNYRVVYNFRSRYAGSPWHQGWASPTNDCHYSMEMPGDNLVLGTVNFNKLHAPGNGPFDDNTIQREQAGYWMFRQLGIPSTYRRYVVSIVNGNRRGWLMEDMQVPGSETIAQHFPNDTGGQLFKLQPWFTMADAATGSLPFEESANDYCWWTLNRYMVTPAGLPPQHQTGHYRWYFLARAERGTANNYTNVFSLIDAANSGSDRAFEENLESVADIEEWMRFSAVEHACGNWDSVLCNNEQNTYAYKPERDRWKLMPFDFNIVLGNSGSWGPGPENLFTYNQQVRPTAPGGDTNAGRIFATPKFRRYYMESLRDVAYGPMQGDRVGALMDAKYAAFAADACPVASPAAVKTWIATMRQSILTTLTNEGVMTAPFAIPGTNLVIVSSNAILLAGTAPLDVRSIKVNGQDCAFYWSTKTNWTVRIPLQPGVSNLVVTGCDRAGNPLPGAVASVTAAYPGEAPDPRGQVVINEIMFNPPFPDAEYVELFNASSNTTFDLSGWRFEGLGYTFPAGSAIEPRGYLVLAKNADAFFAAYDSGVLVYDYFAGNLQSGGETLALVKPGAAADLLVDQVRYDSSAPWPAGPAGQPAAAIQLVDPFQDNSRPGNWITRYSPGVYVPPAVLPPSTNFGWRFMSVTGLCSTVPRVLIYLDGRGECFIDDVSVVNGFVPEAGPNLIRGGDFEPPALNTAWLAGTNYTNSALSSSVQHSGASSLRLVCTTFGNTYGAPQGNKVFQQLLTPAPTNNQPVAIGLWYLSTTNATNLIVQMVNSVTLKMTNNLGPVYLPTRYIPGYYSSLPVLGMNPGQPNDILSNRVVSPAPIVLADSTSPPTVAQPYPSSLAVSGYRASECITKLTVQISNLFHTAPGQVSLLLAAPDGRAVVLMGKCGFYYPITQGTFTFDDASPFILSSNNPATPGTWRPTDLNTFSPFPAPAPAPSATNLAAFNGMNPAGTWTLYAVDDAQGNSGIISNGWSLTFVTRDSAPTPPVWINEVQPVNASGWRDQAGQPSPWLELYNAGASAVSLDSCFLTDDYAQLDKWPLPAGALLQPGEFRLVVCDGLTNLNAPEEWHASFQLTGASRAVALSQPLGARLRVLDYLSFSNLADGLSCGSWPDGQPFERQLFNYPTPGLPNRPAPPPPPLRINEWMAANGRAVADPADGKYQDWFELFNPTLQDVSLAGWTLLLNGARDFIVPAGYTLPARGFLLVWADEQTNQNTAASADLHAGFKLNKDGATLALRAPDGTLVDQVAFGAQLADISQGRYPDGSADLYSMPGFTPRTANVVPMLNTAPQLAPVAGLAVDEGSLATTTVHVTDADLPAQLMTFSLDPGAPLGALVTPQGVFHWRPSEVFGPGVYPVTIRVTDNGTPRLSATASFQITVREVNQPPVFPDTRDRYVSAGALVQFATAADTDLPAQTLVFEVLGALPEGAALDPATGVFSWTPSDAQAPGLFTVQIRATDNGLPPLSASALYTLHVVPAGVTPLLLEFSRTAGGARLSWGAVPGRSYQLEYKDRLDAAWSPWGAPVQAAASTVVLDLPVVGATQRFLRVVQLQP